MFNNGKGPQLPFCGSSERKRKEQRLNTLRRQIEINEYAAKICWQRAGGAIQFVSYPYELEIYNGNQRFLQNSFEHALKTAQEAEEDLKNV